jgi:hypothetical protein
MRCVSIPRYFFFCSILMFTSLFFITGTKDDKEQKKGPRDATKVSWATNKFCIGTTTDHKRPKRRSSSLLGLRDFFPPY